jgi:AraC-like DNA-binding protein
VFTSSRPAPFLADRVDAFWERHGGGIARILPDGCMDFIFDLERGTARLVGTMTRAKVVEGRPHARLFGVRFLPGCAAQFVDAHAHEVADRVLSLSDVTRSAAFALPERVAEAATASARRAIIGEFLSIAAARTRPLDVRVRAATQLIRRHGGTLKISALAADARVGERQLERLFQERLGVSPKHFARVVRMEHTVRSLAAHAGTQAELAAACGYADESHLLRDFQDLAGVTPAELRAEQSRDVGFVQATPARST